MNYNNRRRYEQSNGYNYRNQNNYDRPGYLSYSQRNNYHSSQSHTNYQTNRQNRTNHHFHSKVSTRGNRYNGHSGHYRNNNRYNHNGYNQYNDHQRYQSQHNNHFGGNAPKAAFPQKRGKNRLKDVIISQEITQFTVHKKSAPAPVFHDPQHEVAMKYNDIENKYNDMLLLENDEKIRLRNSETRHVIEQYNNPIIKKTSQYFDDDGNVLEPESDSSSDSDSDPAPAQDVNANDGYYYDKGQLKDTRSRLIFEDTADLTMTINDDAKNALNNDNIDHGFEQFTLRNYVKQVQMVPDIHHMDGNDLVHNATFINHTNRKKRNKKKNNNKNKKRKTNNNVAMEDFDIFTGSIQGQQKRNSNRIRRRIKSKQSNKNNDGMMANNVRYKPDNRSIDERKCQFLVESIQSIRQNTME